MAGAFDVEHIPVNKTNFGVTLLSSAISSSTETITVESAAVLPVAKFYATITPAGSISDITNSEIILVRSTSGNTLTVTRGVRGTTAKAFDAGSVLFNGVYYQDSPYDASEILTTQNEIYTDVQGLLAAINDGRPVIMNQYHGTSDFGGQAIMTSATLTNTQGVPQTITIKYIMDERLVTVGINPTTGAIARSGVNIATSGNKIITGSMIRDNTITSSNVDLTTFPGNYSTAEKNTGYHWIDGKTIYKRTISWGSMPNAARVDKTYSWLVNVKVIKIDAAAITNTAYHAMPYTSASGDYDTVFFSDSNTGKMSVATSTNRSTWQAYITVYYTKP